MSPSTRPASMIPNLTGQLIGGRLRMVKILGDGAYGVVYLAVEENSSNPREFAVKVLLKADPSTPQGEAQYMEIAMHKAASDHPNVLTLHQVLEDDYFIYFILDFCPGGDLFDALTEKAICWRNDYMTKRVFLQIIDAVESIHDKGIFHRDLKPDNILVSEDGTNIFLCDFGLAIDVEMNESFHRGTDCYMSPECIGEDKRALSYSTRTSDVWALGFILMNIITGTTPWDYASFDNKHFRHFMKNPNYFLNTLPISKGANEIVKRIFTYDPQARITLTELRCAILALDTFFLTNEEIALSNDRIREAAAWYAPGAQLTAGSSEGEESLSSTSSDSSSEAEGVGPITPDNDIPNTGGCLVGNPVAFSAQDITALSKALGTPYDELALRLDTLVASVNHAY